MDNANARGIIVLLSLKDFYPDKAPTSTDVEALWKATVAAFVHHPALLGWYLADEVKTAGLGEVSARYAAVAAADPNHITYTVLDGGIMQRAGADGANYRNLSSVLGHDPCVPLMTHPTSLHLISAFYLLITLVLRVCGCAYSFVAAPVLQLFYFINSYLTSGGIILIVLYA